MESEIFKFPADEPIWKVDLRRHRADPELIQDWLDFLAHVGTDRNVRPYSGMATYYGSANMGWRAFIRRRRAMAANRPY